MDNNDKHTEEKTHLEEMAMNAWPALQTYLYDGWIVRFANGYTKRANSVTPLYGGVLPLAEKIDYCEQLYQAQNLRPTFRLSEAIDVEAVDKMLDENGYQRIDTTSVQTVDLSTIAARQSERAYLLPGRDGLDFWLGSFHQLSGAYRNDEQTHKQMLANIRGETGYMTLMVDGEVVACGLGVVERDWLGVFDVITAVSHRNQGYAAELMHSLIAWGKACGAQNAYLQVMTNNAPALYLYNKLGFAEQYQYWYRISAAGP